MSEVVDIAIIGAGAAGLMAGIWAGRAVQSNGQRKRIVLLDSAAKLGAKILVAGGGRCNVTHDVVTEASYAGASRHAIRKVLRRFDVPQTIDFFKQLGVELKREDTGKLFPTTDDARTVLNALLRAVQEAGCELRHPWRVERVRPGFEVQAADGRTISARRVILATGGRSLPKTGSDGHGYAIARSLGHSITSRVFPALVPLTLPRDHPLCELSGLSARVTLEVRSPNGRLLATFTDSLLCTHFGISGPAALDISRFFIQARSDELDAHLIVNWLAETTTLQADALLIELSRSKGAISAGRFLRERELPSRLAEFICQTASVDPSIGLNTLTREQRTALVAAMTSMRLPITGDRGFTHAEVTAGGVPLTELQLDGLESRICPRLHVVGEICDVDGRIGGYNFQWAWASGRVAGVAAVRAINADGVEITGDSP